MTSTISNWRRKRVPRIITSGKIWVLLNGWLPRTSDYVPIGLQSSIPTTRLADWRNRTHVPTEERKECCRPHRDPGLTLVCVDCSHAFTGVPRITPEIQEYSKRQRNVEPFHQYNTLGFSGAYCLASPPYSPGFRVRFPVEALGFRTTFPSIKPFYNHPRFRATLS